MSGQIAVTAITFAGTVIIARLLSPREMGVYAVAMATIGVLQIFTAFGVAMYVVREEDLTRETIDGAFTLNLLLSLVLSLLLLLISFAGAALFEEPAVASVLQMLAFAPPIAALGFTPGVMLQRAMLFRGTSIIGAIATLLGTGVTIVAAVLGARYESPAWGFLASTVFGTLATIAIGREHFAPRLSASGWRRMAAFGARMMSISGVAVAAMRLSELIIGHTLGLAALGLYSRAISINTLLMQNLYGAMTRVVFSKLSQVQRDSADVGPVYLRGLRLVTAVMGPITLGLAVLAGPFVHLLYGEKWSGVAVPLSLIMVSQFISLAFAMNWELFVVRDRLNEQTRLEIIRSVLGVTTKLVGSLFSIVVVAASSIVDNVVSLFLYGRYIPRLAQASQRTILGIYAEACLLALLAVAPALALMIATDWRVDVALPLTALAVVAGAALWLAALFRIDHPLAEELRMIGQRLGAVRGGRAPAE